MKKRPGRLAALVMACIIPFTAAGASEYETYLQEGTAPSLQEKYAGVFEIGIAETAVLNADKTAAEQRTAAVSA